MSRKAFLRFLIIVLIASSFVSVFPYTLNAKAEAKTEYPINSNSGKYAKLSKTYTFKSPDYSNTHIGKSTGYAYIYHKGKKVAKLKLTNHKEMMCIGKYKGKYYFNVRRLPEASAVYSYKLGDKKFKRVCKGLNFFAFKKKYTSKYQKKYYGIIDNRYIIARPFYPTDAYAGLGDVYVYDLRKSKRKLLGDARDVTWVGKKIYWTTTVPHDWVDSDAPVIVVNEADYNGDNKMTVKEIPFIDLHAGYGSGIIDKHYVTWKFMTEDGNATINEKYR